ncbi:MAG: ribosomal protein S18-alanine N-acetyltransferase [Magnetovibrio sp.]|nr:ribosomal protein S18-alanine N-acetyltransferase [Magnetovibrio sp.]
MSGVSLTPALPVHAAVLSQLHSESFDEGWSSQSLQTTLETPGVFGLIANIDTDEPLGFGLFRLSADEAEVITIATRPQVRGQGIARALMDQALKTAQENGACSMFLEVATDNEAALGLYQNLGFEEVGRRKDYYKRPGGTHQDAVVMVLKLS